MLSLKDIVWIGEVIPHKSVSGEIRPPVYPLDRFKIENIIYRINFLKKISDDKFYFTAVKISKSNRKIKKK